MKKSNLVVLVAMVTILMMSAVGCGKSSKSVNVDGSYYITYYVIGDTDITSTAQRNASIRIQDNLCEIGGDPLYNIEVKGNKVSMESDNKVFSGTYDEKTKSFSIKGHRIDDDEEIEIHFEYERKLNEGDRQRIEKSKEHKEKREKK